MYWTNLYEDPETVIDLYHEHGTSEQFHSELETDMDVERFPSGKLAVNAILLHIDMVVFITLRFIGLTCLIGTAESGNACTKLSPISSGYRVKLFTIRAGGHSDSGNMIPD